MNFIIKIDFQCFIYMDNLKRFDLNSFSNLINTTMAEPPQESDLKFDNMTRQDLKKIEKSMKRPEFMGLLNEYMIEISDPKNKIEYDQYLRQMESQKQLPKHMKIVELTPKFCFRTFIVSQKNKKHEMKFFVNMCETMYLEEPSSEKAPDSEGRIGESWKIPNSSGKIRYDQDKKGSPCQVIDVAFHPKVFQYALHKRFQEMIINIALEAAEKQLGERKESLSRDYVLLKNVICKGQDGKPALMPIRYIEGKVYNKGEGPTSEPERDNEGRETKLQKEINKQKEQHDKGKKKKEDIKEQPKEKQEEEIEDKKLIVDMSEGVQRPKYSTIFTYPIDYSEFMDNPAINNRRKVPSVFNIQFSIPRVKSISEIADQKLQINDKEIILKIGDKYFIDLELSEFKLKYVLQPTLAKAKYDKKKKCLRIIIPIDQSIKYFPEETSEVAPQDSKEKESNDIVESQTWKNKVLDFTEPNVSVQILNTQQPVEEAPKLVEQIDEEDEITEKPKQKNVKLDDEDQGEEVKKKQEKFSISNYYKKPEVNQQDRRLKFVFQETSDQLLLVFKIKGYKKEEIHTIISENKEFLLEWSEGGKQPKYSHHKVKEAFSSKVVKVDVIQRVGFVLFSITKAEKGKYWQKQSIEQISYQDQDEEVNYHNFKTNFEKIQKSQREIAIIQPFQQKVEPIKNPVREQQVPENNKIKSSPQPIDKRQEKPAQTQAKPQPIQPAKERANIFNNLQVQFIIFDAPFIEALD